ncbi:hypothetical protein FrEUN1fDRAFT_2601 [Parafrankia sp. EUN1f]|nr:hypothetical protein FrEUN1fDRAFT_2601 [Parafrankia sp. EUN1f]
MMGDVFSGDKFTGQGYTVNKAGRDINQVVSNHQAGSAAQLDAAVGELRALIAQLIRDRAVTPDGEVVADPAAVIAAVRDNPSRLQELGAAVAGGAKDAVLSIVQGGVAAMVVALLGR